MITESEMDKLAEAAGNELEKRFTEWLLIWSKQNGVLGDIVFQAGAQFQEAYELGYRAAEAAMVTDILTRTLAALGAVKVAHRHDCPKMRPKRDQVCSLGVLHLGAENSRCDCYADATDLQIKAIADDLRAVLGSK